MGAPCVAAMWNCDAPVNGTALQCENGPMSTNTPASPAHLAPDARLLVVVSSDYGELGGALYFLQGLSPRSTVTLLVPASLRDVVQGGEWHASVRTYQGSADILRAAAEERCQAALLFAGALLPLGTGLGLRGTWRLLSGLRRLGLPLLTSDPFVGLVHGPRSLHFAQAVQGDPSSLARRVLAARLAVTVWLLQKRLRHACHLYPAPIERLHAPRPGGTPRCSYFSPAAARQALALPPSDPPAWVFVLSQVDWSLAAQDGADRFLQSLAARLGDAQRHGRRAVLIAPAGLLSRLRAVGAAPGAELLDSLHYGDFMRRLLGAEYAFFWNYYSFSILHRVLAQRPVFFFGEGHMVNILPELREAGVRLFYRGWRPPLLAQQQALEAVPLAALARETLEAFALNAAELRGCATPAEILARVLSADQRDVAHAQA